MTWGQALLGLAAGFLIASVTAPVGISGAVFLLPVQLSLLQVPSPAVTPTNLLYNVVAGPGALARYRHQGQLTGPLAGQLLTGTVPGVILGAVIRVYFAAGPRLFRLLAAAVLLPLGIWLCTRDPRPPGEPHPSRPHPTARGLVRRPRTITLLALVVGVVGGIYGIGGGSILGPLLVGSGLPVATVAPAALASTFVTSIVGAATYALLSLTASGSIAPDWRLGLVCGLGGLLGGYVGAWLQPWLPERALRLLLGLLAIGLASLYIIQAVR
jgi:uncharacterized protein